MSKREREHDAGGEYSRALRSSSQSPPTAAEKTWVPPSPPLQLTQRAAGTPITMAAPAAAEEPGAEEAAGFFFDDVDVLPEQKEARKANSVKLKQRPAAVRLTAPADRASSARKSPLLLRNLIRHAGGGLAAFRRSVPPAAS